MAVSRVLVFRIVLCLSPLWGIAAHAQQELLLDLLDQRWFETHSENFIIYSQVSSRQTIRFADELETWRQVAAYVISGDSPLPKAEVPNYVFLFEDAESFQAFSYGEARAFFYPTPRSNFMALVVDDEDSVAEGFHHYSHFLLRNFSDLRLPRWYEEGLAGYLSHMQINRGRARVKSYLQDNYEVIAELSNSLSMERLLYRDDALASPRVIQIASLKSETLLHYFLHAHQEDEFPDRRDQLEQYLALLMEDRNPRFAYDRSFDITTDQLDDEYHQFLLNSRRPEGEVEHGEISDNPEVESVRMERGRLAVLLGDLALNSSLSENAQILFQAAIDSGEQLARGYSGLGDSLRFQELEAMDQTIASYFQQALEFAPDDTVILLDYGEYWEAELNNCDKEYPVRQRNQISAEIKNKFEHALALEPDNPEANLAMGQFYLLEGQDWREGLAYQDKAFSLLPADTFIMEQAIRYAIEGEDFDEAQRLIDEMAQPIHNYGEPEYISDLRVRLLRKRRSEPYDVCAQG